MKTLRMALLAAAVITAILLVGCSAPKSQTRDADVVGPPPKVISPPPLETPQAAVVTYLDYVTLGYRMANSEAASQVITPYEEVRVDAYIQMGKEQNQGIDQKLINFSSRLVRSTSTTATVATKEDWIYRYFDLGTLRYVTPATRASYVATYTLTQDNKKWLVDKVVSTEVTSATR